MTRGILGYIKEKSGAGTPDNFLNLGKELNVL
nr:MAG TPA: hypothetical protein [Bacteriophage sp.]